MHSANMKEHLGIPGKNKRLCIGNRFPQHQLLDLLQFVPAESEDRLVYHAASKGWPAYQLLPIFHKQCAAALASWSITAREMANACAKPAFHWEKDEVLEEF